MDERVSEPCDDPRRWAMFCVLLVGAFLPPLDFFIVNVALPSIRTDLGASPATLQLVISGYGAAYAVTLITGGRLGDIFGRSRVFFSGILGFAAASTLCGLAPSPAVLIVGRILQGLTAAVMAPQCLASIQAIFPEVEKPRALGLYGAVFGLASVIGQALGGILIAVDAFGLGWRLIFLVNLPVVIAVLAFGLPLLREVRGTGARQLDFGGVALSSITLALIIVPLVEGREMDWPAWAIVMLVISPMVGVLFWKYEKRLALSGGAPLVDLRALTAPGLGFGLASTLLFYAISVFFLLLSVYLQGALGETALFAGLTFLPFGLGFLLGPLATPWAGRIVGRLVTPIGMGFEAAGFFGLSVLVVATPVGVAPVQWLFSPILFLIGFGQGLALPTLVRAVTSRVAVQFTGLISGIVNSVLQISGALSVAVIGGVFYAILDGKTDPGSIAHAFVPPMLCIAGSLAIAAVLALQMIERKGR